MTDVLRDWDDTPNPNTGATAGTSAASQKTVTQLQGAANTAVRAALDAPPATAEEPGAQLYFPTVLAFVTQHLAPTYRRSLSPSSATWCPEWWKHAEAIARLEALWRSWEHLRLDPATGISVWFRDHADHHMAILLSAEPIQRLLPRQRPLPTPRPPTAHQTAQRDVRQHLTHHRRAPQRWRQGQLA